jgi:hypothetical protein
MALQFFDHLETKYSFPTSMMEDVNADWPRPKIIKSLPALNSDTCPSFYYDRDLPLYDENHKRSCAQKSLTISVIGFHHR